MIFIRVYFLNEFGSEHKAVIEVSRSITMGELSQAGYYRIELL